LQRVRVGGGVRITYEAIAFFSARMSDKESKSLDILGIKPISDAVSLATKAAVDGASAFLGKICLPAAEELGELFRDKVRVWRANNFVKIISEAEAKYNKYQAISGAHAHPRLVAATLEHGSWSDDKVLQEMWGGLLTSSCSEDGRDESNLIFINLLSQLTSLQVRILNYACDKANKVVTTEGLILPARGGLFVDVPKLKEIAGTDDIHRLDREMDHLRGLELIKMGFSERTPTADIIPTALAFYLYVRCQGFTGSPAEFFGLKSPVQTV